MPDGIDWDQLTEILAVVFGSPVLAGFSLACYNPEKDVDGANGSRIVKVVGDALVVR